MGFEVNSFDRGREIENKGVEMIAPLLRQWAGPGRLFNNMSSPPEQQRRDGDFLIVRGGRRIKIEFKTELKNLYGNFFFETFSNLNKGYERKGWLYTCKADGLLYLFQETRELYAIHWPKCQEWLLNHLLEYKERNQGKYQQSNSTVGRPVPIKRLLALGLAKRMELI